MPTPPSIVDLFSGVGGMSLGATRAGFRLAAAVELDSIALHTHAINFPSSKHLARDVSTLSGADLLHSIGHGVGQLDGLIGGPPCQGFSSIGLRSTADPRNDLLMHFCRLVSEVKPAFFLMENVPGLLDQRNAEILSRALAVLPSKYVVLKPMVVKASSYGAPTRRTRVFFYGYDPNRIAPLYSEDFAPNRIDDVKVEAALRSLPAVRSSWLTPDQGWRAVGTLGNGRFDTRVSGMIPPGVGNEDALHLYRSKLLASGFMGTMHTPITIERFKALRPGQRDSISKCERLDPDGYCPTLRAGTDSSRGSYMAIRPVHPNSPRVISPREAARLQGFPDWFQFHSTKWHAFRQIGNSVSPLVAEALLRRIATALNISS